MTNSLVEELVRIPVNHVHIEGILELPDKARGLVLLAHGGGSSRRSPRNNFVASALRSGGFGTLMLDLLTPQENLVYETRFDIALLTRRLLAATHWVQESGYGGNLPLGYFGAGTGAAAALQAAALLGREIAAVVSRGGRPDMAGSHDLEQVLAPALLLVGSRDDVMIELNREAYVLLQCQKVLSIVPGAGHLFDEPGTLEEVARQATTWFNRHLRTRARGTDYAALSQARNISMTSSSSTWGNLS